MSVKVSLKEQVGKAAIWQLLGGGWQAIIRLGASTVLARELTPLEFGIFAIALIVQEFVTYIGGFGMGTGIIAKKDVSDAELCTCFWTMAGVRTIMFILCLLLAPLAAIFFGEPRVEYVIYAISFIFIIQIPEVISQAILTKKMAFGTLNVIRGAAILLESILAIILTLNSNLTYWALVIAMLINAIFTSILIFYFAGWKPTFNFDKSCFRYYSRFGLNGLGFSIMNYFNQNADYLVVGKILGVKGLGLYEFAYKIPHLIIDKISRPISAVIFPALSKLQNDKNALINGYTTAVSVVIFISYPLLTGLISLADILVLTLWGEQWTSIVLPMQILAVCAMVKCVVLPTVSVMYCLDRPDIPFKVSIFGVVITFSAVTVLGGLYGINGVAFGMLLAVFPSVIQVFIMFYLTKSNAFTLIRKICEVLVASVMCGLSAYISKYTLVNLNFGILSVFSLSIFNGALMYILVYMIFFRQSFLSLLILVDDSTGKRMQNILSKYAKQ